MTAEAPRLAVAFALVLALGGLALPAGATASDHITIERTGDHLAVSVDQSVYPSGTDAADAEVIVAVEALNGSTTVEGGSAAANGSRYRFEAPVSAVAAENVSLSSASVTVFANDRSATAEVDFRQFVFGEGDPVRRGGQLRVPVERAWGFSVGGIDVQSRQGDAEDDFQGRLRFDGNGGGGALVFSPRETQRYNARTLPVRNATVRLTAPAFTDGPVSDTYSFERRLAFDIDGTVTTTADGRFAVPARETGALTPGPVPVAVSQGNRSRTVSAELRLDNATDAVVLGRDAVSGFDSGAPVTVEAFPSVSGLGDATEFTPAAGAVTTLRMVDGRLVVEHPLVSPGTRYSLVVSTNGSHFVNETRALPGTRGGRLRAPGAVAGAGSPSVTIRRNGTALVAGTTPTLSVNGTERVPLVNGTMVFPLGERESAPETVRAWTLSNGSVVALPNLPHGGDYEERWWANVSQGPVALSADRPRTFLLSVDGTLRTVTAVPAADWPESGSAAESPQSVDPDLPGRAWVVLVAVVVGALAVGEGVSLAVGPDRLVPGPLAVVGLLLVAVSAAGVMLPAALLPSPLVVIGIVGVLVGVIGSAVVSGLGTGYDESLTRSVQSPQSRKSASRGRSRTQSSSGTRNGGRALGTDTFRVEITDNRTGDRVTDGEVTVVVTETDGTTVATEDTTNGVCEFEVDRGRYIVTVRSDVKRASTVVRTGRQDEVSLSIESEESTASNGGEGSEESEIGEQPPDRNMTVSVVDGETGDPLTDATVELRADGQTRTQEPNAAGNLSFSVPGSVESPSVAVTCDGYHGAERTVDLTEATSFDVALEPRPPGRIEVSVTADGDPAGSVPVAVDGDGDDAPWKRETDERGIATVDDLSPGRYEVIARVEAGEDRTTVSVDHGETASAELSVPVADPWASDGWRESVPDIESVGVPASLDSGAVELHYDDFEKERVVGQGGNADVYEAAVTTLDDRPRVALKEPRIVGTLQTETVERILSEARHWQQVDDHDHVVTVYDWAADPIPWLAMEYMDGGHLGERLGAVDPVEGLWIAARVSEGVWHANQKGFAHLDLKPENVLFRETPDGRWDVPKVGDWGLSRRLLDQTQSMDGLTPQYAAPEQFDDEYGESDVITDVYQLGAVFYALFTGEPPFDGAASTVMHDVLHEPVTPPSEVADVPDAVDDVVMRALEKEKSDRYESVLLLRDELRDMLDSL